MKIFNSLDKRQLGDVQELIDLIKSYLILWGYKPEYRQLEHIKEMLAIIVKK